MVRELLSEDRDTEYFTREGLTTMTGLIEGNWKKAIAKELIDNALDAIDDAGVDDRTVTVTFDNGLLVISDSANTLGEDTIDQVFDFSQYVSSKRHFRVVSRGYQGNALKTVIGICYNSDADLSFVVDGKRISYTLDRAKLKAGVIHFNKTSEPTSLGNGVYIQGLEFDDNDLHNTVFTYHLANPDINFRLNDDRFPAEIPPEQARKKKGKTFIHWYTFNQFDNLLQAITVKDPNRTTKDFCLKFSGTQRILSRLQIPKKLSDFNDKEDEIKVLYDKLLSLTEKPKPTILQQFTIGKDPLSQMFGAEETGKYKVLYGEFSKGEAVIPYCIEGFILKNDEQLENTILSAINNSISYQECPFNFSSTQYVNFCKKEFYASSLEGVLDKRGWGYVRGLTLFIHFISPYIEFTDKAKANIIAWFSQDLLKVVESLTKDTFKEIDRAEKQRRQFDRKRAYYHEREPSKKYLMEKYCMDAYKIAIGGYSAVLARQIFYTLRNIINIRDTIDLNQGDYNTFTQEVMTDFIERNPGLKNKILFERRGYFYNPFLDEEIPLGTLDVQQFINRPCKNKITRRMTVEYDLPTNLQFSQALYIEKQGFNIILKESGLLDELNLAFISGQGFGTRASKDLMEKFITDKITVYVLHDCDIAGYQIWEKIAHGSNTFGRGLKVKRLGLTLKDVKRLKKLDYAETVTSKKSYSGVITRLTQAERNFFVPDYNTYRRVEINTLTNPELIQFIRENIPSKPIIPGIKQIESYIDIDPKEIWKEALFEKYCDDLPEIEIDTQQIAAQVHKTLKNGKSGQHWAEALNEAIADYRQKKIKEILRAYA